MDRAHGVRADRRARVVEDHVQDEVVQRLGEVYADLAASAGDGVNDLACEMLGA